MGLKLSDYNFLIVEDDEDLREAIYDYFSSLFKNTYIASNGEEALQIVIVNEIDFILSDIKMPMLNGIEFLKTISDEKTKIPKILFMSGESDYTQEDVMALGARGLINKPFTFDFLLKTIIAILEKEEPLYSK